MKPFGPARPARQRRAAGDLHAGAEKLAFAARRRSQAAKVRKSPCTISLVKHDDWRAKGASPICVCGSVIPAALIERQSRDANPCATRSAPRARP